MPLDVEERYERRAPFGVPFAEYPLACTCWSLVRSSPRCGCTAASTATNGGRTSMAPSRPTWYRMRPPSRFLQDTEADRQRAGHREPQSRARNRERTDAACSGSQSDSDPSEAAGKERTAAEEGSPAKAGTEASSAARATEGPCHHPASNRPPASRGRWRSSRHRRLLRLYPSPVVVVSVFLTMWPSFSVKLRRTG